MHQQLIRRSLVWFAVVFSAITAGTIFYYNFSKVSIDPETRIFSERIRETPFRFSIYGTSHTGEVWATSNNILNLITKDGESANQVHVFEDLIRGIHVMENGFLVVSTDNDHWSEAEPSRVFLSRDNGGHFTEILRLEAGSALWWSIASDNQGTLFIGEYGPKGPGESNRVWRSRDFGDSWKIVYQAPVEDNIHIHRVAVDPYTQHIWITFGDGPRGTLVSTNGGDEWELVREEQSTAVAFTPDYIFWGEDRKEGKVTRWSRASEKFDLIFEARKEGAYGGSCYNIAYSENEILVPFLKYPDQDHMASLWSYNNHTWTLLMTLGTQGGFLSIGGPDVQGRFYVGKWIVD